MQTHLDLIPHKAQGALIYQRPKDGYINATAMCRAAGRRWNHYVSNATTTSFVNALAADTGIPASELIQSLSGGIPELQGTWVHPQVAIHLAQWVSPEFAVQVSKWVFDWLSGKGSPQRGPSLPYHLRRYVANQQNVPAGYFSILSELTQALIAPLEAQGYTLPEHLLPDISHGLMFCKWLRSRGIDTDALPKYWHVYEDGRRIQAKAYPEELLGSWRRHFREEWLPNKAVDYFRGRDSAALAYLPKLIAGPKAA